MGFLDRLAGRAKQPEVAASTLGFEEANTAAQPPAELPHHGDTQQGPPQLASEAVFPGAAQAAMITDTERLYDPWSAAGLNSSAIGARRQAFSVPSQPEFVFEEEAAVKRRGWSEHLQYSTGVGYLLGGGTGVAAGLYRFATVKPEIPLTSFKLRTNRLLNMTGAQAKPLSHGAAILGLFFASLESWLISTVDDPSIPDAASTVLAGGLSGALFRSPRGPRAAAAAGAVGMVAGGGIAALRQVFPSL